MWGKTDKYQFKRIFNDPTHELLKVPDGSDYDDRTLKKHYPVSVIDAVHDVLRKSTDDVAKEIVENTLNNDKRAVVIISYPPDDSEAFKFVKQLPHGNAYCVHWG